MQTLHLIAGLIDKAFEPAPGPVILGMLMGLRDACCFQMLNNIAHILHTPRIGHQHRIIHHHGHNIFQPKPDKLGAIRR